MSTMVDESPDLTIITPLQNDRRAAYLSGNKIIIFWNLTVMNHKYPGFFPDIFHLKFKQVGISKHVQVDSKNPIVDAFIDVLIKIPNDPFFGNPRIHPTASSHQIKLIANPL